jgi:hypothetical protein
VNPPTILNRLRIRVVLLALPVSVLSPQDKQRLKSFLQAMES